METRNLIVALLVATGAFFLYMSVVTRMAGNKNAEQPVVNESALPEEFNEPDPVSDDAAPTSAPTTSPAANADATPATPTDALTGVPAFNDAKEIGPVILGNAGENATPLTVTLSQFGAAVTRIDLTERKANGEFVNPRNADESDQPYTILNFVESPAGVTNAFDTHRVWVKEIDNGSWRLDDIVWEIAEQSANVVTFATSLQTPDGGELLQLTKRYELADDGPFIILTLGAQNRAEQPLTVTFAQDGPIGIARENDYFDMRKVVVAKHDEDGVAIIARARSALKDNPTILGNDAQFAWSTAMNKYFGVFVRALPREGSNSLFTDTIKLVKGDLLFKNGAAPLVVENPNGVFNLRTPDELEELGYGRPSTDQTADMVIRHYTRSLKLEPGTSWSPRFEVYAGPRDTDILATYGDRYVDKSKLGYSLTHSLDSQCFCAFESLTVFMSWLLRTIYSVVRNYGVAIIILVIIVRTLLHPLAVFQQKSMFRMQENMARIQPKIAALKEKYANDKVKQNQEMMRLMAEENVNPAGQMVAFIPMLIQMPILIALWTALNTDVELRLAPFDGYWIKDLSRPDAFIKFPGDGITIPLLSSLPFIGKWFTNISSFNLLPILMGVSMYLQQKYMPKPHLKKKLEEAKKNPQKATGPGGMTFEDQIKQQQMIAYLMSILFPIMFYRFPSGLALYWLATNVYGVLESLRIRKQLDREAEQRKLAGPAAAKPKKAPGPISRMLKRMAEQAEELQKQADKIADQKPQKKPRSK